MGPARCSIQRKDLIFFQNHDRCGVVCQVGNRNVAPGEAELLHGMNDEPGLAGGEIGCFDIGPVEAPADGFEESFFGGEAGG